MKRKLILALALLASWVNIMVAQQTVTEFDFDFNASDSVLNTNYKDNLNQINRLVDFLSSAKLDPNVEITNIELSGFTSLENTHESNTETSQQRVLSLRNVLYRYSDVPESIITYNPDYIDWESLKKTLSNADIRYKSQAQEIINRPQSLMKYNGIYNRDRRIFGLRWLGQGEVWRFMESNVFADMGKGRVKITTAPKNRNNAASDLASANTIQNTSTPAVQPANPEPLHAPQPEPIVPQPELVVAETIVSEPEKVVAETIVAEPEKVVAETVVAEPETAPTAPASKPKVMWSTPEGIVESTTVTQTVTENVTPAAAVVAENISETTVTTTPKPGDPIPTSQLAANLGTTLPVAAVEPTPTAELAQNPTKPLEGLQQNTGGSRTGNTGMAESIEIVETTTPAGGVASANIPSSETTTPKVMWSTPEGIVEAKKVSPENVGAANGNTKGARPTQSPAASKQPEQVVVETVAAKNSQNPVTPGLRAALNSSTDNTARTAAATNRTAAQNTAATPATVPAAVTSYSGTAATQGTPVVITTAQELLNETYATEGTNAPIPTADFRRTIESSVMTNGSVDSQIVTQITESASKVSGKTVTATSSKQPSGAISQGSIQLSGDTTIFINTDDIEVNNGNTIVVRPDKVIIQPNTIIIRSDHIIVDSNPSSDADNCAPQKKNFNRSVKGSETSLNDHNHFYPKGSIKTNLVGWGLAQLNIAFDFDMGPHWSFSLPFYYSGWNYFKYSLKFRICDIKPEFRYWPSAQNTGFYVGLHPGFTWFNFAFDGEYRFSNNDHRLPAIGGGLSLGYRIPISRNRRWHMEFGVSGGIYYVDYAKYVNVPNGKFAGNETKTYYGLDGAQISFLYSFRLK